MRTNVIRPCTLQYVGPGPSNAFYFVLYDSIHSLTLRYNPSASPEKTYPITIVVASHRIRTNAVSALHIYFHYFCLLELQPLQMHKFKLEYIFAVLKLQKRYKYIFI